MRAPLISLPQSGIVARGTGYFKVSCVKFKKLGPLVQFSTGNFKITCPPAHTAFLTVNLGLTLKSGFALIQLD